MYNFLFFSKPSIRWTTLEDQLCWKNSSGSLFDTKRRYVKYQLLKTNNISFMYAPSSGIKKNWKCKLMYVCYVKCFN